ncbi:MAG: hypothetical protein H6627_08075 [Calditrichae bacterium]|nr:hypothetical protein [Calditrichia bacterium]
MKQITLLIALMLLVSFSFAQNTAQVNQTGNSNDADVEQIGSNIATIDQINGSHDASVYQNGTGNNTDINQDGAVQKAIVNQQGNSNTITSDQNSAGIKNTEVKGIQQGDNNSIDFDVDMYSSYSGKSTATIKQIGDANISNVFIEANGTSIGQTIIGEITGDENKTDQSIYSGYTNYAETYITGNKNDVDQSVGGGHSKGKINILGNENIADQYIRGAVNGGYSANYVLIDQIGDDNEAHQTITGTNSGNSISDADIYQNGFSNYASQSKDGSDTKMRTWQTGNDNSAKANIYGNGKYRWSPGDEANYPAENYVLIDQDGNDNSADVNILGDDSQITAGPRYHSSNKVNLKQNGTENDADINVSGALNYADVDQLGNENTVGLSQSGLSNSVKILQQNGDYNTVNLAQSGGGVADITQDGNTNKVKGLDTDTDPEIASFSGAGAIDGLDLSVLQQGDANTLKLNANGEVTVSQIGNNNNAIVSQQ